eukprot:TRINITY_DN1992_c0_g1_i1.p1 TRINITY_DN1992_c0_g1~~TRINITY_DN1992_c0_g1_i1.p1  ORF type:complete len:854 (+),score=117.66 TRINITY_DN1992_c0_g1_i1:654-3215(+)
MISKPFENQSVTLADHLLRVITCITSNISFCTTPDSLLFFEDVFLQIPFSDLNDSEICELQTIYEVKNQLFRYERVSDRLDLSGFIDNGSIAEKVFASDLLQRILLVFMDFVQKRTPDMLFFVQNIIQLSLSILSRMQPVSKRRQLAIESVDVDFPLIKNVISQLYRLQKQKDAVVMELCLRLLTAYMPSQQSVAIFERALLCDMTIDSVWQQLIPSIDNDAGEGVTIVPQITRVYEAMQILMAKSTGLQALIPTEDKIPWPLTFAIRAMPRVFRSWMVDNGRFPVFTHLEELMFPFIHGRLFQRNKIATSAVTNSPEQHIIFRSLLVFFSVKNITDEHVSSQHVPLRTWLDIFHLLWQSGGMIDAVKSTNLFSVVELKTVISSIQMLVFDLKNYFSGAEVRCESLLDSLGTFFSGVDLFQEYKILTQVRSQRLHAEPIVYASVSIAMQYDVSPNTYRDLQSTSHVCMVVEENRFLVHATLQLFTSTYGANLDNWSWRRFGGVHVLVVPNDELNQIQRIMFSSLLYSDRKAVNCPDGIRAANLMSNHSVTVFSSIVVLSNFFWTDDLKCLLHRNYPHHLLAPIIAKSNSDAWIAVVRESFMPAKLYFDQRGAATKLRSEESGLLRALWAFIRLDKQHYISGVAIRHIHGSLRDSPQLRSIANGLYWNLVEMWNKQFDTVCDYDCNLGQNWLKLYELAAAPETPADLSRYIFLEMHVNTNIHLNLNRHQPKVNQEHVWMQDSSIETQRVTEFFALCRMVSSRLKTTSMTREQLLSTSASTRSPRQIVIGNIRPKKAQFGGDIPLFGQTQMMDEYFPMLSWYVLKSGAECALRSVFWTLPYYISDQLESRELVPA